MNNLGVYHQNAGNLEESETCLSRALLLKRQSGASPASLSSTYNNLARQACMRGQLRRGVAMFDEALELTRGRTSENRANQLVNRELTRIFLGETGESEAMLDEAERLAERVGAEGVRSFAARTRAELMLGRGRFDEAIRESRRSIEFAHRATVPRARAQAMVTEARALLAAGDRLSASAVLEPAQDVARQAGDLEVETDVALAWACCRAAR
jgi:tetratricopeptide (TPR) repeat protein